MALAFIISFLFLLLNQAVYIYGGDSAEFSLTAQTFNIPHAPGYPLYSLLINAMRIFLPFGTVTWKASLMSSIPAVLTAFFLYKILTLIKIRPFFALTASLLYLFLFPVWLYAEVPEVYSLHTLLVTAITYLVLLFNRNPKPLYLYSSFLLLGLSVAHHHTFVLFIPGWYIMVRKKLPGIPIKQWVTAAGCLLLGILPYAYAPIASRFNPPYDWESAGTIPGFIRLVTRASYGTFSAYHGSKPNILYQIYDSLGVFIYLLHDFRILGLIFVIIGLIFLNRQSKTVSAFTFLTIGAILLFIFITNFPLNNTFVNATYERYLINLYLVLIIPLALGMQKFHDVVKNFLFKFVHSDLIKSAVRFSLLAFVVIFGLIIAYKNNQTISRIKTIKSFEYFGKDHLDSISKNSILSLTTDEPNFTSSYQYYANHYRTDIRLIMFSLLSNANAQKTARLRYPEVYLPKQFMNTQDFNDFLTHNSKKNDIYGDKHYATGDWEPWGLVWKYYPSKQAAAADTDTIIKANYKFWGDTYHIPKLNKDTDNLLFLKDIQNYYLTAYGRFAEFLYNIGKKEQGIAIAKRILFDFDPLNFEANLFLVYDAVNRNDCMTAKKYTDNINLIGRQWLPNYLMIEMGYYEKCDARNPKLREIKKLYENVKDSETKDDLKK